MIEAIPHNPESDSFQFRASFGGLKRALVAHWLVVVATTLLTTGLVTAYILIWPPTYEAKVMIAADSDKDAQRSSFYSGWNVFRQQGLADEGALLTSGPVLRATVQRLNLKYEDIYHPFFSYLTHLWSESAIGNAYRKVKYWFFPKVVGPYEPSAEQIEASKVLADFRESTKLEAIKDTNIGLLTVKASNQRAAEIANAMTNIYLEQRREGQLKEATQARDSLADEVGKVEADLAVLEQNISRFRKGNNLLLQYEKDKVQIGNFESRRLSIGEVEAQIVERQAALNVVERNLGQEAGFMNSARVFKDIAAQELLARLEVQLALAKQQFQEGSREIREVEEQIKAAMVNVTGANQSVVVRNAAKVGESYELLRTRKSTLESQLSGDIASLRKKKDVLDQERKLLDQLPEKLKTNHEFERSQAVLEAKLRTLYEKLAMASVSVATVRTAPPALRVIEYAANPEKPVWPRTNLFIAGAILSGLLLGILAALLLDLAFERVNLNRLLDKNSAYRVFAFIDQDEKFLNTLYFGQNPPPPASGGAPGS